MADDTQGSGELRTLLPLFALNLLDDIERTRVERLLAHDDDARREADRYLEVVAAFAPDIEPPAALRAAVLEQIDAGTAAPQRQTPASAPVARRRRWGIVAAAAAVVLAVGIPTTIAVRATTERQSLQARADAVSSLLADPGAVLLHADVAGGGTASVLAADGDMYFRASGLPTVGADRDYQLWVITPEGMVSAGVLDVEDGRASTLVEGEPGTGMALTIEPDGGSPQPTADPIAVLQN